MSQPQLQMLIEASAAEDQGEIIMSVLNNTEGGHQFSSAAFIAAYFGKLEGLKCLLNLCVDSSSVDTMSEDSLLHIAAAQNQIHVVEEVYKREPGLAQKLNKDGVTSLHVAIANGHQDVF